MDGGHGNLWEIQNKICTLACWIAHKSWMRQDQLCHLGSIIYIFEPTLPNFKIFLIQNSKFKKKKKKKKRNMTKTRKH